jgi:hypothetical protein
LTSRRATDGSGSLTAQTPAIGDGGPAARQFSRESTLPTSLLFAAEMAILGIVAKKLWKISRLAQAGDEAAHTASQSQHPNRPRQRFPARAARRHIATTIAPMRDQCKLGPSAGGGCWREGSCCEGNRLGSAETCYRFPLRRAKAVPLCQHVILPFWNLWVSCRFCQRSPAAGLRSTVPCSQKPIEK